MIIAIDPDKILKNFEKYQEHNYSPFMTFSYRASLIKMIFGQSFLVSTDFQNFIADLTTT